MPCYKPIEAWRAKHRNDNGKVPLVFNRREAAQPDDPIAVGCGKCIGCRLERSRQWAVRCMHEAQMNEDRRGNCFVTLTFDDHHLYKRDNPYTVDKRDHQLFLKNLRERFVPVCPYKNTPENKLLRKQWFRENGIKFYMCGEYGSLNMRPHYHLLLFNHDFEDKTLWKINNGQRLYRSETLEKLWPYGYSSIGAVTFESAAYVARYIMKKQNGEEAERFKVKEVNGQLVECRHYEVVDPDTGELFNIEPEYTCMSRADAIGKEWFENFGKDVLNNDYITVRGVKSRPPSYYDRLAEKLDPEAFDLVKMARSEKARDYHADKTRARLDAMEQIRQRKINRLVRNL